MKKNNKKRHLIKITQALMPSSTENSNRKALMPSGVWKSGGSSIKIIIINQKASVDHLYYSLALASSSGVKSFSMSKNLRNSIIVLPLI